jgi:hypothetical protein
MADLTTIEIATVTGRPDLDTDLTAAASGGDTAEIGPAHFLLVLNAHISETRTVTIDTPGTVDGHAIAQATLVVTTANYGIIPLTSLFRGSTGRATITYSDSAADITVAVYKLGK